MMRWRSWRRRWRSSASWATRAARRPCWRCKAAPPLRPGSVDAALASYRGSLARFRALGYTEAREQALYDLRAWRRQVGPGEISRQIGAILAEEPEKRYVARFPSSKIALLQVLSLAALPLTLLLTAIVSPTAGARTAGRQPARAWSQTYYDPLLGFGSLLILAGAVCYRLHARGAGGDLLRAAEQPGARAARLCDHQPDRDYALR